MPTTLDPNTLYTQDDSDLGPFDWAEIIGKDSGWNGDVSLGFDNSQAVMTIGCYWTDVFAVNHATGGIIPKILGTNFAVPGTPRLDRRLPMRYPRNPFLRASRVLSIKGVHPRTKGQYPHGPGMTYKFAHITILFTAPQYDILDNSTAWGVTGEWGRFVDKRQQSVTTYAQLERGAFRWGLNAAAEGKPVAFGPPLLIPKKRLTWKWMYLPTVGLFNSAGITANIDSTVGKVNMTTFAGFPPGTLLMEDPVIEPMPLPYSALEVGGAETDAARCWNVTLNMLFFDPPTTGTLARKRGHNVFPQPTDFTWWPIETATGAVGSGAPVYDSAEFGIAFAMCTG